MSVAASHGGELIARPLIRALEIRRTCESRTDTVHQPRCVLHHVRVFDRLIANTLIHVVIDVLALRLCLFVRRCCDGAAWLLFCLPKCNSKQGKHANKQVSASHGYKSPHSILIINQAVNRRVAEGVRMKQSEHQDRTRRPITVSPRTHIKISHGYEERRKRREIFCPQGTKAKSGIQCR